MLAIPFIYYSDVMNLSYGFFFRMKEFSIIVDGNSKTYMISFSSRNVRAGYVRGTSDFKANVEFEMNPVIVYASVFRESFAFGTTYKPLSFFKPYLAVSQGRFGYILEAEPKLERVFGKFLLGMEAYAFVSTYSYPVGRSRIFNAGYLEYEGEYIHALRLFLGYIPIHSYILSGFMPIGERSLKVVLGLQVGSFEPSYILGIAFSNKPFLEASLYVSWNDRRWDVRLNFN